MVDPRQPVKQAYVPIPLGELVQAQQDDSFCQACVKEMEALAESRYFRNADGVLRRKGHLHGMEQVVILETLRTAVLTREHNSPMGGHPGARKLCQTIHRLYYWPPIVADTYGWVAACATCAQNWLMERRQTVAMHLLPATEPFSALAMDLLGPLPKTEEGNEYLLVICDRFTKSTRAVLEAWVTIMAIVSAFLDH